MYVDPIIWWKTHEGQFSNVGFLAKWVFGIVRFQIEIEKMFNLIGVLTTLKSCHLQVQNLNQIITIINNWPNDPCQNSSNIVIPHSYGAIAIMWWRPPMS